MSLRTEIIGAVQSGALPVQFRCTDVKRLVGNRFSNHYIDIILSNSEVLVEHSPTYKKFTVRRERGVYEVHPSLLN